MTFTATSNVTATRTSTATRTATATRTFTPTATVPATLQVLINEVAWAGTESALPNDEWIELYNPGSSPVDLTGWQLISGDENVIITLSGTIDGPGYFLLERTDNSTVLDINRDQIYTGGLTNSGVILRLFDASNVLIDTANAAGGAWPAGSSTTFGTMERRGVVQDGPTAWVTNTGAVRNGLDANSNPINGTPRQSNWALTVTLTASVTPSRTRTPTATRTITPTRTPTKPPTPTPRVVINEILPRAGFDWNGDGAVDVYDEFIEVMNLGPVNVNLKNWKLDDEQSLGSAPFSLPERILKPGERAVFYGSTTHILLEDSGDTVRLINTRGIVVDAHTYGIAQFPDRSACRIQDGIGFWNEACFPTPENTNALTGDLPTGASIPAGGRPVCLLPDLAPDDFRLAECDRYGAEIWNRQYWDSSAGQNEYHVPDDLSKWETFVE